MTPYYDQDGITIWHADCADILPDIDPVSVDLVLTDPPYGMDHQGNWAARATNGKVGGKTASRRTWGQVAGDDQPFDPTHLLEYGTAVIWGGNWFADRLPATGCWIVWNKRGDGLPSPMQGDAELAWTNLPSERVHIYSKMWHGAPRWREEPILHPTQKPAALMRWILERWTEPNQLILDPYMGSGPVAQAAADLGRRYIGIELEEQYCAAAVGRLAQQTLPL